MCVLPILVSLVGYGFYPRMTKYCSLFSGFNKDNFGVIIALSLPLFFTILLSIITAISNILIYSTVTGSQKKLAESGGRVSGKRKAGLLKFGMIVQPILMTMVTCSVSVLAFTSLLNMFSHTWVDILTSYFIPLVNVIDAILSNIKIGVKKYINRRTN